MNIEMKVAASQVAIPMEVSPDEVNVEMSIATEYKFVNAETYEGSYSVTPSTTEQVIPIKDYKAKENIVVEPIPSNYGLITWDGTTLTVS